jgi:hypothetical protein
VDDEIQSERGLLTTRLTYTPYVTIRPCCFLPPPPPPPPSSSSSLQEHERVLRSKEVLLDQRLTQQLAVSIKKLCLDPAIQTAFQRSSEFQLYDSTQ